MTGKVIRFPTELRQAQVFEDRVDAFLSSEAFTPPPDIFFEGVLREIGVPLELLLWQPTTVQVVVLKDAKIEVGDLISIQDIKIDENDLF